MNYELNKRIAVIMPEIVDPSDYELVKGAHLQAKKLGLDIIIITGIFNSQKELQQDDYIHALENIYTITAFAKFDGILFASERFRNRSLISSIRQQLKDLDIPCLAMGDNGGELPTVHARQRENMYCITEHLINVHGCRDIWFITGTPDSYASAERTAGYRQAMEKAGLPVREDRIFFGDFWKTVPARIGQQIVSGELERPDAIACASDVMAVALMDALEEGGIRVPEDIAVTGYDGGWYTLFRGLTTISGRDMQFGAEAVCRLADMMGIDTAEHADIPQMLNIRTSCGCSPENPIHKSGLSLEKHFEKIITHIMFKQEFLISDLIERFSSVDTLDEWISQADRSLHILDGVQGTDLCLCDDWEMDPNDTEVFRQWGYSDSMFLALSKRRGCKEYDRYKFPVRDMMPALTKPHEPLLAVLTALSLGSQVMGYVACYYDDAEDIQLDDPYVNWCNAAANGLRVLQNKDHQRWLRERVEQFAVRDPVTGFLNRRGLAEALPDFIAGCRRHHGEPCITVLGCAAGATAGYDTSLLLANSLRSTLSEDIIICRAGEQIYMVLSEQPLPTLREDTQNTMADLLGTQLRTLRIFMLAHVLKSTGLGEQNAEIGELAEQMQNLIRYQVSDVSDYRDALQRLRQRMIKQPQRDWNITDITREIGISTTHMQRLYRELFDTTLTEDLITMRIEKAEYLLTHTDLRIAEIAAECGYNNETHFMRQFKKRTEMTPTQFREKK
ncbi:substrate-binding domain-containing protein [Ruminococcus sp.]|uniref:substrate-binding domain-containing protein n=1 Tax=Ruminococcus sp. TaxID=41978 RepID=UPI001B0C8744|nr:substrate-binding domain-containing protein [Ruminococcus sp.]MBO5558431.1 substrate-binding domain-containing protein [Ruminococcus sp.]